MPRKTPKKQLNSQGKTELAKAISRKSKKFAKGYARVEIKVGRFFRWISSWMDKLLFNQKHGKIIALMLAVLVYVSLNSSNQGILETSKSAEVLGDYKISQIISSQNYEVSGLPKSVKVRAIGDLNDIKNVSQHEKFRVVADMSNLTEGVHDVKFKSEAAPSQVDIVLEPSSATVKIKKKSIRKFNLGFDYLNRSSMDPIYDLSEPSLEQGEVLVRASSETLNKIAFVKALIKVDASIQNDFDTKAKVFAYDMNGKRMNVDIIPDTLKASVGVSKPSKNVAIVLQPSGSVPNGKAIASYVLDYPSVEIFGSESVLENIDEIPIVIPANTLTNDRKFSMPIIMPNGVTKISQSIVNIDITLGKAEKSVMNDVDVEFKNQNNEFTFAFASKEPKVQVQMKGAKNVLDVIQKEDVKVYVDVSKIDKAGSYEQPLLVSGKNKLVIYELKDASIKINVAQAK